MVASSVSFDGLYPNLEEVQGLRSRKIAEGTFPPQLKISANGTGWHESEINRWIANPAGWRQRSRNEFGFLDDY